MTKKRMKGYPKPILMAWSAWEMWRRLGFESDDIFFEFAPTLNAHGSADTGVALNATLRSQGLAFRVTCSANVPEPEARKLLDTFKGFMEEINADRFTQKEMDRHFRRSVPYRECVSLLATMRTKGFVISKTLS